MSNKKTNRYEDGRIANAKWEICRNSDVHQVFDFLQEEEIHGAPIAASRLLRFMEVYKEFREFFVSIGASGLNLSPRPRRLLVLEAKNYAESLESMIRSDKFREELEFRGYIFKEPIDD